MCPWHRWAWFTVWVEFYCWPPKPYSWPPHPQSSPHTASCRPSRFPCCPCCRSRSRSRGRERPRERSRSERERERSPRRDDRRERRRDYDSPRDRRGPPRGYGRWVGVEAGRVGSRGEDTVSLARAALSWHFSQPAGADFHPSLSWLVMVQLRSLQTSGSIGSGCRECPVGINSNLSHKCAYPASAAACVCRRDFPPPGPPPMRAPPKELTMFIAGLGPSTHERVCCTRHMNHAYTPQSKCSALPAS
jgi:hypothetical protein